MSETQNQDKRREFKQIDWNRIFTNQTQNIYEPLVNNIRPAVDNIFKKYIYSGNEDSLKSIDKNVEEIKTIETEIQERKRADKISGRKFANGLIFFLFFLIIGLFFLSFFLKNKKVIKSFLIFESAKRQVIKEKIAENNVTLRTLFNQYSLIDWKNKVLNEMNIKNVYGIDPKDFDFFYESPGFYGFNSIEKYNIRNSFYYDVIYKKEYWKDIVTQGTGYITVKTKDGWTTVPVHAYHTEPTPFMDIKHAINVPTNYRPDLILNETADHLTLKQYNKTIKKGEFLLENPEFYQHYNFSYNDKIGFIDYFKVKTQENFVEYSKYFSGKKYIFGKYKNNIYVSRKFEENFMAYSISHNWINLAFDLSKIVTIDDVYSYMVQTIFNVLQPTFKALTQIYLNTNIASENYEKRDRYLSDYVFDEQKSIEQANKNCEFNVYEIMNKASSSLKFNMKTQKPAKDIGITYSELVKDVNDSSGSIAIKSKMFSYWKEDLIDHVYTRGIVIDVPFERFYPFSEDKWIIFIPGWATQQDQNFLSYQDNESESSTHYKLKFMEEAGDGLYDYNINFLKNNRNDLLYLMHLIKGSKNTFLKSVDHKILIDKDGLFVFVNDNIDKNQIQQIFNIFRKN
ncbi:hypothetical protein [Mycoplasmopsis arginini]|uniref:Uncharacterized protein n=1 Tax=Mycoplasmopsis arginini TaxID=2094 RepID=A0AA43QX63_MYCAR|nr:hypothetical protein [Mycoplasmopsis arginini]ENY69678.1 Hypothetical protein, predicted transmembrane protein [Mycoplasmopsis arginini 7264]MCY2902837.1 hypothetical protein [Mycoplasmopsis arginini QMP CG1-2758]MDI3348284.1 hypothetical protein [Mycoplasmopsis arginini]MDI3348723.1 hypothetical protein [Mycoplasmopsis arginini]MDI3349574.1 hypothetical protein [Mycoplasmopsis arginini]